MDIIIIVRAIMSGGGSLLAAEQKIADSIPALDLSFLTSPFSLDPFPFFSYARYFNAQAFF